MSRFTTPAWRLAGSVVSWLMFAFFFGGLFQSAGAVIGLGGSCASGGPYAIETVCPDAVVVFAPVGIFGMMAAAGVALVFVRGFGVSLIAWAWPILFVGLGGQFIAGAVGGYSIITNVVLGLMFIVMGLAPVAFLVRGRAIAPTLVGSVNIKGARFVAQRVVGRPFGLMPVDADAEAIPTPLDWVISLGLWVVSAGLGSWLSVVAFAAVASAG